MPNRIRKQKAHSASWTCFISDKSNFFKNAFGTVAVVITRKDRSNSFLFKTDTAFHLNRSNIKKQLESESQTFTNYVKNPFIGSFNVNKSGLFRYEIRNTST